MEVKGQELPNEMVWGRGGGKMTCDGGPRSRQNALCKPKLKGAMGKFGIMFAIEISTGIDQNSLSRHVASL